MAAGKKNAQRQRAWIVFEDESGVSDRPPIRSTWAPKGETPIVTHPFHWKKVSVAGALAYRWDGRRCHLLFHTKPDSYNSLALIRFLHLLRRHFRGRKVIMLWDRLNAHRSVEMLAYLRQQRWLQVEALPTYAPELNPVEFVWGNVKGKELANLSVEETLDVVEGMRRGLRRVRRQDLGLSFLTHAGLSL